jgi:hypothetical protein
MRRSVLAIALLALAPAAEAGEPPAPPRASETPAQRLAKVVAAFPAPSAKAAFEARLEVTQGGVRSGAATLCAAPDVLDGKPAWRATGDVDAASGGTRRVIRTVAWLAADLGVLKVECAVEDEGGPALVSTAVRDGDALRVTVRKGDEPAQTSTLEARGVVFCALLSHLLFLRQAPAEAAEYETTVYDPLAPAPALARGTLGVRGAAEWSGASRPTRTIWAVERRGAAETEFRLSPEREPLALFDHAEGQVMAKPGLLAPPPGSGIAPPASAREAASRFALGSSVGDLDLVMSALHLPSLHEAARRDGSRMSDAEFRAQVVAGVRANLRSMAREKAEPLVVKAAAAATETPEGDATKVAFGPPLGSMAFVTKRVGDGWYVVRLPGP